MFADDTTFQISSQNLTQLTHLANCELEKASVWFQCNKLTLNVSKTKFIIFRNRSMKLPQEDIVLKIGTESLERVGTEMPLKNFKFLGHIIDEHLTWADHISHVRSKVSSGNYALAKTKHLLPPKIRLTLYNSLVRSHLEYGIITWGGARASKLRPIEIAQKKRQQEMLVGNHPIPTRNPSFQHLKYSNFRTCLGITVPYSCINITTNTYQFHLVACLLHLQSQIVL